MSWLKGQEVHAAITIYHEARGESMQGQIAVCHVILNRCLIRAQSIKEVVFAPKQFSCFNDGHPPIDDYAALLKAQEAVDRCLAERLEGKNLHGSDHYFATYIAPPSWSKEMALVTTIGKHVFFRS